MPRRSSMALALPVLLLALQSAPGAEDGRAHFMSLEASRPVLQAMSANLPTGLRNTALNAANWSQWLATADAAVRRRLDAGEEDTLTNLLRFGVTFTSEYRIDDEYFQHYGDSTLVDSFADRRARDLLRALAAPGSNAGFREMRALLERHGYRLATPAQRAAAKQYLLKNMARMHQEFLQAKEQVKTDRLHMFQNRGISLDSNLWPDYDLDLQLRQMMGKGMLKPGSIRRVAIVGPGLDFANKQEGVDFYPPQTVQPFALLDSLLGLGLAGGGGAVEVYTLDISSLVNAHLSAIRREASSGRSYTVQLPWFTGGRWNTDFRGKFVDYWQALGSHIGQPVRPIPAPEAAAGIQTRAVRIAPAMISRVHPVDMNIVYQALWLPPEERFDMVVGTNIFLYYGPFEQSLARANIASMLKPGGYLLSNDRLAEGVPSGLDLVMTTEIPMTEAPVIADSVFCYRRISR